MRIVTQAKPLRKKWNPSTSFTSTNFPLKVITPKLISSAIKLEQAILLFSYLFIVYLYMTEILTRTFKTKRQHWGQCVGVA